MSQVQNIETQEEYECYINEECMAYFSSGLDRIEYPGGKERTSVRLVLQDGRRVICSYRLSVQRTACEVYVLRKLQEHGAPVPRILAFNGELLWQEDLGDQRLSTMLQDVTPLQLEQWLSASLDALVQSHQASEAAGLDNDPAILRLGTKRTWLKDLLEQPAIIGKFLNLKVPKLNYKALHSLLSIIHKRHIKWDARPGNAMIRRDASVVWFDWEHAGIRNRLDDLVWFLADETLPEISEVETRILNEYTSPFADKFSLADAQAYVACLGVFHICVRLGLILYDRLEYGDPWRKPDECIAYDRTAYSRQFTQRLCRRGARWAAKSPLTEVLAPWFDELEARIKTLSSATDNTHHVVTSEDKSAKEQGVEYVYRADEWDQFLQSSRPDIGFMQSSWWAHIKATSGWSHFDVTIKDAQGILGGARVLTRSFAPGTCFYYVPEGPVLPEGEEAAEQVFQKIIAEIGEKRNEEPDVVSHLRIEPRWAHRPSFVRGCREASGWIDARNTLCIDLRLSESALLAQMKPKGRYNIGVARRHGVSIIEDLSPQGVADFWEIYDETFARQGLDAMSARYYQEMMKTLIAVERASIFFAKYQGKILSGALVIYFGDRATYYIGGSRLSHRRVMAPYLLHFEALLKAKALGHRWYDFYGVSPLDKPNDPWANFSVFKRKFGGCELNFVPALDFIYDADAYQDYRRWSS